MVKTPSGMTPQQARIQRERTQAFRDRAKPITPGIDPTTNRPNTTVTGGVPIPVTRTVAPVVTPKAKTTNSNEVTYMIGGRPRTFDSRSAEAQGYAQDSKYETQEQYNKRKEKQKAPFTPGAEDYVQAEYNKGREAGQKFSGIFDGNVMPSSAEGELKELARKQRDERNYQAETQALQAGLNQRQLTASKRESESAQAASVAAFAQNREGAMSGTAKDVIGRYAGISGERIQTAVDQVNLADLQMKEARRQLSQAQKGESRGAIERYQGAVAAADQAIKQANIDLANAESRALSEARQFQASERQNIETFTGLLDSGVQIDLAGVLNLSSQLGVPTDLAASYYSATDQIRKDKTLSSEAKQIELNTARQDFDDRINGFQTKEAQKIRDYERLVRQGYDPGTLAVSMDISNDKNPVFQAELALKVAETNIKNRELQGLPVGFKEFQEYADAQAANNSYMGTGGTALVPPNSLEGISMEWDGGRLQFELPTNPDGTLRSFQCGEFVNRAWGISRGGGGGFPSELSGKAAIVKNRGIGVDSVNINNYQNMIKPGMAFVSNESKYGHVGIITQVLPNGEFLTMEANIIGDMGKGSPPTEQRRNIADGNLIGFTPPPNAIPQGKDAIGYSAFDLKVINSFNGTDIPKAWAGNKQDLIKAFNTVQEKKMSPGTPLAEKARLSIGGSELLADQSKKMESFQTVAGQLRDLEVNLENVSSDKLAPIWGKLRGANKWNDMQKVIESQLIGLVPGLARGVYGEVGVLTDADIANYKKLLPTLKDTKSQRNLLMDMLKTSLKRGTETTLNNAFSSGRDVSKYADLIEYSSSMSPKVEVEDDDETTYLNSAPVFDSDADSIWKNIGSTFNRLF